MKYLIPLVILLSGCIHTNKIDVNSNYKPTITNPIILKLEDCRWDIPRNTKELVIKNESKCKSTDVEKTSEWFKNDCLEHPVDVDSNLMIGFDEKNYLCFVRNMETIRYTLKSYNERIKLYNTK